MLARHLSTARGAIANPAVHEGHQPPLEAQDELAPGLGITGAHLPDKKSVGVRRCHRVFVALCIAHYVVIGSPAGNGEAR